MIVLNTKIAAVYTFCIDFVCSKDYNVDGNLENTQQIRRIASESLRKYDE